MRSCGVILDHEARAGRRIGLALAPRVDSTLSACRELSEILSRAASGFHPRKESALTKSARAFSARGGGFDSAFGTPMQTLFGADQDRPSIYLESPESLPKNNEVIDPFLKGHGDSR